jgi:hypothetical protein
MQLTQLRKKEKKLLPNCDQIRFLLQQPAVESFVIPNRTVCVKSLQLNLGMSGQIPDVFLHGISERAAAGVNVRHDIWPRLRMRQGQVDAVALSDVARQHERCEDGQIVQCVFNIFPLLIFLNTTMQERNCGTYGWEQPLPRAIVLAHGS